MSLRHRLKQLEEQIPLPAPVDREAAKEYARLWNEASEAVWATIPDEYRTVIHEDIAAIFEAYAATGERRPLGRLTRAYVDRIEETMKKSILPQAMPAALCQAILDHEELVELHECEDCRMRIPLVRVVVHTEPTPPGAIQHQSSRYETIFDACPLCGGKVGWYAYLKKHEGAALSALTKYQGFLQRYYELEQAWYGAIEQLGPDWMEREERQTKGR